MLLSLIQGVFLVPFYIARTGVEQYGIWLTVSSVVAVLALADFGVSGIATQKTAQLAPSKSGSELGRLIGSLLAFESIASVFIFILGLVLTAVLPKLLSVQSTNIQMVGIVATLDTSLMLAAGGIGGVLIGLQKPLPHYVSHLVGTIFGIILSVLLMINGSGVLALALGSLMRPVVVVPVDLFVLRREATKFGVRRLDILKGLRDFTYFKESIAALGPAKIAEALIPQANNIVVATFLGPAQVTILTITRKVSDLITQLIGRLPASLLSGFAHLSGSGEQEKMSHITISLTSAVLFLGTTLLAIAGMLNHDFVTLWTSNDLFGGEFLTLMICVYGLFKLIRIVIYNVVFASGEIRSTANSILLEGGFQVLGSFTIVHFAGLTGAVAAGCLATVMGSSVQLKAFSQIAHVGWARRDSARKSYLFFFVALCIILIAGTLKMSLGIMTNWFQLIIFAGVFTLLTIGAYLYLEFGTLIPRSSRFKSNYA